MYYSTIVNVWWYCNNLDKFYILYFLPLSTTASFFSSFPLFFFFDSLLLHFSLPCSHLSLLQARHQSWVGFGVVTAWWSRCSPDMAEIEVVTAWQRSAWARRGGDRSGHSMARLAWARRILMGLFDFLLFIFVFWVWMGWILDSYGLVFWILMGLCWIWIGWLGWRAW